jgi:hypothetical protein
MRASMEGADDVNLLECIVALDDMKMTHASAHTHTDEANANLTGMSLYESV